MDQVANRSRPPEERRTVPLCGSAGDSRGPCLRSVDAQPQAAAHVNPPAGAGGTCRPGRSHPRGGWSVGGAWRRTRASRARGSRLTRTSPATVAAAATSPAGRHGDGQVGHARCRRRARRARARSGSGQAWSAPGACRDHTHRRNVRRTGRTRRSGSSWPCGPCGPRAATDHMAVAAARHFPKVAEFEAGCRFRPYHDIAPTAQRPRERLLPVVPMVVPMVVPTGESCSCVEYARVDLRVAWCRLPQPGRCV